MSDDHLISKVFSINLDASEKQALEREIVAGLKSSHLTEPESWSEFAITAVSNPQQSSTSVTELLGALNQATECYDQIWVNIDMVDSPVPLLNRIKQNFHQLTLFYVNMLGEKQTRFNDRILRVVNALVGKQLKQDTEIAELKEQIAQLQATIAELEQKD